MVKRRKASTRKTTRKAAPRKATVVKRTIIRKTTRRKTTKKGTMRGRGFKDSLMTGLRFIKDNKVISGLTGMIPDGRAQTVSRLAGMVGLGRPRSGLGVRSTTYRPMHGRGIFSGLSSIFA